MTCYYPPDHRFGQGYPRRQCHGSDGYNRFVMQCLVGLADSPAGSWEDGRSQMGHRELQRRGLHPASPMREALRSRPGTHQKVSNRIDLADRD